MNIWSLNLLSLEWHEHSIDAFTNNLSINHRISVGGDNFGNLVVHISERQADGRYIGTSYLFDIKSFVPQRIQNIVIQPELPPKGWSLQ